MPSDGFRELVSRAQAGDKHALRDLLEALRPYMEHVAQGYADPARGAESTADLVQESWMRAWEKLSQFRAGESDEETRAMLHGWIGQIVHRLGLNLRRDQKAKKRSPEDGAIVSLSHETGSGSLGSLPAIDSGPTPSGVFSQNERSLRVRQVVDALPDSVDRAFVQLRFFEGLSLADVARKLGLTYEQARERFRSLSLRLERELEELL